MIHFTLYSRSYCHLCDDMLQALQAFKEGFAFTIEVIDVDADDSLVEKYDELVPVLTGRLDGGPEIQLCHYFLDSGEVEKFLQR